VAVVFFYQLQIDVVGGVIGVIEFAAIDAEELQSFGKVEGWGDAMP
jgi:hypothetical protein